MSWSVQVHKYFLSGSKNSVPPLKPNILLRKPRILLSHRRIRRRMVRSLPFGECVIAQRLFNLFSANRQLGRLGRRAPRVCARRLDIRYRKCSCATSNKGQGRAVQILESLAAGKERLAS